MIQSVFFPINSLIVEKFTAEDKLTYLKMKVSPKEYEEILKRINISALDKSSTKVKTPEVNSSKLKRILKYVSR